MGETTTELEQMYSDLPKGVAIISLVGKTHVISDHQGTRKLHESSKWHEFISEGNFAKYLIGTPDTSEEDPANATVKVSVTKGNGCFTPHAHKSSHYVAPMRPAGCLVYNEQTGSGKFINVDVGQLLIIEPMVIHAFYNRWEHPLGCIIANNGLGINREGYAITKEIAQKMKDKAHSKLLPKLSQIHDELDAGLQDQMLTPAQSAKRLRLVREAMK